MKPFKKFDGKEYEDLISVIIPLYRSFDSSRVKISIDSLKQQRKVNLEIVVAEQSDKPSFHKQKEISYMFVPLKDKDQEYAIPGLVRNRAAKSSSGNYIYNSDGDIVYLNPYYFAEILELIKTGDGVSLCRPPMRRLPIEDFDNFKKMWEELGLRKTLENLDMSEEFTAKMPGSKVSIVSFRKKESGKLKTFLYSSSDFKKYNQNPKLKGNEPKYSTLNVHAGATFMEKRHFHAVGGFCEKFTCWGCHDADLQWKLRKKFNLIEFPNFPEYEVLHLDHERNYFDKERWQANLELQRSRRAREVDEVIKEDLKNGN